MDAAIGRLQVRVTFAPIPRVVEPETKVSDVTDMTERAYRRQLREQALESDRGRWAVRSRYPGRSGC